jgi:hypothetical protein
MLLSNDFIFSQNNLQNYIDCRRKFYLKHILQLQWPVLESEPSIIQEERTALGAEFHLLCNQYFSGVPESAIRNSIESPEILQWWNAFIELGVQPGSNLQAEKAITVPFLDYRLTVHYDLLNSNQNGTYLIYDWKTNLKQPQRTTLAKRMQTVIYPLVLQLFLETNSSKKVAPENIELIYWYPVIPGRPIRFPFGHETYSQHLQLVEVLITEIMHNEIDDFHLTESISQCDFCQFRSFCNRGVKAGDSLEMVENLTGLDLSDDED